MRRSLIVLSILFVACSGGAHSPTTGITGVVTVGPMCPVMVEGSPCPDGAWTGTVRAVATPGGQVFEAQTNVNGRFSFEVPPGTYDLTPVVAGPQTAQTTSMTVTPGQIRDVTLRVDSGIR